MRSELGRFTDPELERLNREIRGLRDRGEVLITPPENQYRGRKCIFNNPVELCVEIAKNGQEIASIAVSPDRIRVTCTLHNIYPRTHLEAARSRAGSRRGRNAFMNEADALRAVIEFVFSGAVEPGAREAELRRVMLKYRRLPLWPEKLAPIGRSREARREALPKLSPASRYLAKLVWYQERVDPRPLDEERGLPACQAIYRALREGRPIASSRAEATARGRPRGAISRHLRATRNERKAA